MLDTNILISATFWRGAPREVVYAAERSLFTALLSEYIIREYREATANTTIQEKVRVKGLIWQLTEAQIRGVAELVEERTTVQVITEDPDDDHILACALDGNATHIVTRDRHLLSIGSWRGIRIVTPEEFLAEL